MDGSIRSDKMDESGAEDADGDQRADGGEDGSDDPKVSTPKKLVKVSNLSSSGPGTRTMVPMTRGTTFRGAIAPADVASAAMNWNK